MTIHNAQLTIYGTSVEMGPLGNQGRIVFTCSYGEGECEST